MEPLKLSPAARHQAREHASPQGVAHADVQACAYPRGGGADKQLKHYEHGQHGYGLHHPAGGNARGNVDCPLGVIDEGEGQHDREHAYETDQEHSGTEAGGRPNEITATDP